LLRLGSVLYLMLASTRYALSKPTVHEEPKSILEAITSQSMLATNHPYIQIVTRSEERDGFKWTGIFDGGNLSFGTKEALDGKLVYEGHFNSKGNLDWPGTLTYPDGRRMEGIFVNGECLMSCTFTFPSGGKDIGTRNLSWLDGPNCTRIRPNNHTQIGRFEHNEFVSGTEEFGPRKDGVLHGDSCTRYESNGTKKTGRFQNGLFVEGVESNSNGDRWEGKWNSEGKFHGEGKVIWAENSPAIDEWGTYENGQLINGTVRFRSGMIETGPRQKGALHGTNCTRIEDTMTWFGEFEDGKFVSGTGSTIATDGMRYEGPFKGRQLDGIARQVGSDASTLAAYFYNGQLIVKGKETDITLANGTRCADVFAQEGTPLLLDPAKVKPVSDFLANLKTFASDAYGEFAGQMESQSFIWTSKTPISQLSPSEKVKYYKVKAQELLRKEGPQYFKEICVDAVVRLIKDDPSVLLGVRSKRRFDKELNRDSIELFAAFLNLVNEKIKDHLPDIDILPEIHFEDSGQSTAYGIYTVHLEQHQAIYNAHYGSKHAPRPAELLNSESDWRNPPFYYFNGLMYRIPVEAVRDVTPPRTSQIKEAMAPFYVTGNYYFQATASRRDQLGPWKYCVNEYFSYIDNQVMPKVRSFIPNIFAEVKGWW